VSANALVCHGQTSGLGFASSKLSASLLAARVCCLHAMAICAIFYFD